MMILNLTVKPYLSESENKSKYKPACSGIRCKCFGVLWDCEKSLLCDLLKILLTRLWFQDVHTCKAEALMIYTDCQERNRRSVRKRFWRQTKGKVWQKPRM